MRRIHLDFETYSDVDIKKAGAFRYIQSPAFEILLCAYSVEDGPVSVLDLTVPQERDYFNTTFKDLIFCDDSVLMAYNAAFEAGCIARHFNIRFTPAYVAKFRDTMLHGLYAGYTAGLDATGRALGIPEDKQKLATGKALIRYFCVPCKPTKANGGMTLKNGRCSRPITARTLWRRWKSNAAYPRFLCQISFRSSGKLICLSMRAA